MQAETTSALMCLCRYCQLPVFQANGKMEIASHKRVLCPYTHLWLTHIAWTPGFASGRFSLLDGKLHVCISPTTKASSCSVTAQPRPSGVEAAPRNPTAFKLVMHKAACMLVHPQHGWSKIFIARRGLFSWGIVMTCACMRTVYWCSQSSVKAGVNCSKPSIRSLFVLPGCVSLIWFTCEGLFHPVFI